MGIFDGIRLSPKPPSTSLGSKAVAPTAIGFPPAQAAAPAQPSSASHTTAAPSTIAKSRRWSFQRTLDFFNPPHDPHKPALSLAHDESKRALAAHAAQAPKSKLPSMNRSDRRAKKSAFIVRELIVGPEMVAPVKSTGAARDVVGVQANVKAKPQQGVSKVEVNRVKTQLLAPKAANRVIAQLRTLPATGAPTATSEGTNDTLPIHAVCLPFPELETQEKHFCLLQAPTQSLSVATATFSSVSNALKDLHLVSLLTAPNMGLGAPADADGIFAGAVPTAETVITGIEQITPQLMALGYATGRAVLPDHTGVYPPTDRMSVLTYWWGLELVMPPPTIAYLDKAESISHTVMNFLTALGVLSNGVREILPFVRYISQSVEFEFNQIRGQDEGKGVVCAATWIMPAAMVPRPWDFPPRPPFKAIGPSTGGIPSTAETPAPVTSSIPDPPAPATPPQPSSRPISPIMKALPATPSPPPDIPPTALLPGPEMAIIVGAGA